MTTETHAVMNSGIKHQYHLVDPSPLPLVASLAAGTLATGAILFMHGHGSLVLILGALAVAGLMAVWFRQVVKEATFQGHHSPIVQLGLRYGMVLFIASEVMFFAAFFWAFFGNALFPAVNELYNQGGVWPPKNIEAFEPFKIPLLNTIILLSSGVTVTWAHHALIENNRRDTLRGLGATIGLGLLFTMFQAWEYSHAPFGFKDGIYASTFFMATGFHGFHVIIGTIFLAVCWFRAYLGHFKPDHHFGFEAAAWYWHFVDVVWLFLFFAVYVWGGYGAPH